MNYNQIKAELNKRIEEGLSKVYPEMQAYYVYTTAYEDLILFNRTCTIYSKKDRQFYDLDPEAFIELRRHLWNEQKALNKEIAESKEVELVLYDNPITLEDGEDTFLCLLADPTAVNPEDACITEYDRNSVRNAITKLDDIRQRVIIGLFYREMTEDDLAKELGMTQGNVHYHKVRGLDMLRKILREMEEERE